MLTKTAPPWGMPPRMNGMPRASAPAAATASSTFSDPSSNGVSAFRGGEEVAIVGLKSQPHLNGRCAFVGAFDEASGRFEAWLSPISLTAGHTGMKMNWIDLRTEDAALAIRVKPTSMQILNLTNQSSGGDFASLNAAQKPAVLRAQKRLWDEATMFKDGKKRAPNVVSLFRVERQPCRVQLVLRPQEGVLPADMASGTTLVVRQELEADVGIAGYVYVVCNHPKVRMSFFKSTSADSRVLEGKEAADTYIRIGKV